MDFSDYQIAANRTSGAYGDGVSAHRQAFAGLALAGEVGELCNLLKKRLAHGHDIPDERIGDELGDVLWYVAELCAAHGLSMEDVAKGNVAKLSKRYPNGFSQKDSQERVA